MKKLSALFLLSMSCLLLISCSKNLSRDKAKELIIAEYDFPKYETDIIYKEYLKLDHCLYKMRGWEGGCIACGPFPKNLEYFQNNGLIVIGQKNIQGINGWTGKSQSWIVYTVTLTVIGKQYFISESSLEYRLKTCDVSFGEITGIQIQKQFNNATVNYTVIRKATPFGFNISQGSVNKTANFSLFDDGWRINR